MTLVERYLRAVRDNLPRGQQDDIINELNDSIQSRFEDEEAALGGRPLTEDEQVAILQALRPPDGCGRAIPRRRAIGDVRAAADRTRAVPDVPEGPLGSTSRSR